MNKLLAIISGLIVTFSILVGCGFNNAPMKASQYANVNNFDNIEMTIVPGSITPTGLTVEFSSSNMNQCIYGQFFALEMLKNSKWFTVPYSSNVKGEIAFTEEGYMISKGEIKQFQEDWDWLYGKLSSGQYRIIKEISDFRAPGDSDKYYLAAEFSIE